MADMAGRKAINLEGRSLRECTVRHRTGASIVGLKRGSEPVLINSPADTVLAAGDFLIGLGRPDDLRKLAELMQPTV